MLAGTAWPRSRHERCRPLARASTSTRSALGLARHGTTFEVSGHRHQTGHAADDLRTTLWLVDAPFRDGLTTSLESTVRNIALLPSARTYGQSSSAHVATRAGLRRRWPRTSRLPAVGLRHVASALAAPGRRRPGALRHAGGRALEC